MARTSQKYWGPPFWLIVGGEREGGGARPMTVNVPGRGDALAVFSFEEEAQMYLLVAAPEGSWRVEEVGAGELATLLLEERCSGAEQVVLDPMGEIWAREANRLLSMSRDSSLDFFVGGRHSGALATRQPSIPLSVQF